MSAVVDDTIEEFGRSLGMEGLRLRDSGALVLDIANIGELALEWTGEFREQISLSLARHIEPPDEEAYRRILEACHYRSPFPWPVHAAFNSQGALVFAVGLEHSDFTLPNIHQITEWLDGLHQQLQPAVRLV